MPLLSSTTFSNHKGGCGKTVLLFHAACEYAARNPDVNVAVFDMTVVGDMSRLMLGGDKSERDSSISLADVAAGHGGTTRMLMDALNFEQARLAEQHAHAGSGRDVRGAGVVSSGGGGGSGGSGSGPRSFMSKLRLSFGRRAGEGAGEEEEAGAHRFAAESYLCHAAEINMQVPDNVFVALSTGESAQYPFSLEHRILVSDCVRQSFNTARGGWKAFFDTDGDLHFSPYTLIALGVSDNVVVPLFPSFADFHRVETFLEELYKAHQNGESSAKVQMIVWNNVDVYRNEAWPPYSQNVTPNKAAQSVISTLNKLLANVAARYTTLFVHPLPDTRDAEEIEELFSDKSSMIMRQFGVTGMASSDHGLPFCSMEPGKLEGGAIDYTIGKDALMHMTMNVRELSDTF